jgi:N6-adenosine-specific RNA methylase IME4
MSTVYRTIVVDPPWAYPEGWPVGSENGQVSHHAARRGIQFEAGRRSPLKYEQLSVTEIAALPVRNLADPAGCHLYLWTTNRYLRDAFDVVETWGFRFGQVLVWCKAPMGIGPGGAWAQTTEYVLAARLASLRNLKRFDSSWQTWPRMGKAHSRKPEAFLDMVEETSPTPRLEMFARRQRLGWDTWGDQALNHVEIAS